MYDWLLLTLPFPNVGFFKLPAYHTISNICFMYNHFNKTKKLMQKMTLLMMTTFEESSENQFLTSR